MEFNKKLQELRKQRGLNYCVYCLYGDWQACVGVHWISDIIGGALFSAGLVMMYYSVSNIATKNC